MIDFEVGESSVRDESFEPPKRNIPNISSELRTQDVILSNKIADNTDNELNNLLQYYRQRIDTYEDERLEWLQKVEEIKIKLLEKHQQEIKVKQLKESISEIQQSISEQKLSAFAERIAYLNLSRQNADLKIQDMKNRKKIAELISFSEPKRNAVIRAAPISAPTGGKTLQNDLNIFQSTNQVNKSNSLIQDTLRQQVTTVYFPKENLNSIAQENESLKAQKIQERRVLENQCEALERELGVREEELKLKQSNDQAFLSELERKFTSLERYHYNLNKHYFDTRRKCNERLQILKDEKIFLQQRNSQLINKLEIAQKSTQIENEVLKDLETKKSLEYASKFQNQSKSKTEQIEVMKEQYAQIQGMYQSKMNELEANHSQLSQRYKLLLQDTEQQKQDHSERVRQLQEDLQALQQEQLDRGLFPTKPEFKTYEQKQLDEQLRVQNELRLEKIKMRKQKEKIYREANSKQQQRSFTASYPRKNNLKKGSSVTYDLQQAENELDSLQKGLKSQ